MVRILTNRAARDPAVPVLVAEPALMNSLGVEIEPVELVEILNMVDEPAAKA